MIRRPYSGTEPRPQDYTFIRRTGLRSYDFVAPWWRQVHPGTWLLMSVTAAFILGIVVAVLA